jgi:hypothetical protein
LFNKFNTKKTVLNKFFPISIPITATKTKTTTIIICKISINAGNKKL